MNKHLEAAEQLLEKARLLLKQHQDAFNKGMPPEDMHEFEETVKQLCQQAARLPKEQGQRFQGAFETLSNDLTTLAQGLDARKAELEDQIASVPQNQRAQVAYRTAEHLKPKE